VTTQQRERESLQKDMDKLQKDFKTLQGEVTGESKKVHADFLLRLENLQTEVRTLGTGIEEYKELSKKPSKEMDRLKENIALRTKALEDKEKILDDKDKNLEERIKGIEERLKGLEGKIGQLTAKQSEIETSLRTKETSIEEGVSARAGDLYKDAYESYQRATTKEREENLRPFSNSTRIPNSLTMPSSGSERLTMEKDYEKAILEYEKPLPNIPKETRPLPPLETSLRLSGTGDKTNGRNLLKRVMGAIPDPNRPTWPEEIRYDK
jgi:tetratricopeptide (TPR) repeat protein